MTASILRLNHGDIKALKLRDVYSIHKLIYSLFPGNQRNFLYADSGGNVRERSFLILSEEPPLEAEHGILESKTVPESFLEYNHYAFQVRLNPVYRTTGSKAFLPIKNPAAIREWFLKRQRDWGFQSDEAHLEIEELGLQEFKKGERRIIHNKATFKGVLTVTAREQFRASFKNGIGRGKAFGFGLLQLKPLYKND